MTWEARAQFRLDQCLAMVRVDHILTHLSEVEDHQVGWVALFLWVLLRILFLNPPVPIPMEYQGDISSSLKLF